MSTVFCSELRTAEQRRHESRRVNFDELALQVADDVELDPDEVAEQLDQLGRTAEELSNAAQLIVDRRNWSAQIGRDAELHAEHNRLYAEQQAADVERDVAIKTIREKHAAKSGAIQTRLATIAFERDQSQTARNRLMTTSPHHARLSKLWTEHGELVCALQTRLGYQLRQAKPADVGFFQGEISRTQAAVARLAAEIAQLEREALQP